jgi:hypothetical protein
MATFYFPFSKRSCSWCGVGAGSAGVPACPRTVQTPLAELAEGATHLQQKALLA